MTSVKTYAQLVRLPNLFTALADILLGALACGAFEETGWWRYVLLLAASACLYSGGMVWNDFFDVDQDRRERPYRPIPSGRVSRSQAGRLGTALLASGLFLATASGFLSGEMNLAPATIGMLLIAAILSYDAWLKRTPLGPVGMGLCRFLNVLMALALCASAAWTGRIYLAMVVGIYIVGVTWFARTEARISSRASLVVGAAIMLLGLCLALPLPIVARSLRSEPVTSVLFPYLLVALAFLVGIPVMRAQQRPKPELVQAAVKRAIFGLVLLDATLATALAGVAGLAIALLLLPAMYLGRWLYST
jgi:4-hydroxybenzoate polyprenyltransferase